MTTDVGTRRGFVAPWVLCAAAFALAIGMLLGVLGLRTSGFSFSLSASQLVPVVLLAFAGYLVVGLLPGIARALRRPRGTDRSPVRGLVASMTAVTVWFLLTVSFLPIKGSETFVRAGTLTTFQLNVLGLAAVLIVGLVLAWLVGFAVTTLLTALRGALSPRAMRVVGIGLALVAVAVLVAGSSMRSRGYARAGLPDGGRWRQRPRLALIGVDGCDWEMLGPLVEAGELPNFARLMDRGAYGPLLSMDPMVSPRIWTTIATGELPEEHGITGFTNAAGVPVNARMRRSPALWEIVSSFGGVSAVTGWYVTWPTDDVRGYMVSDRVHSLLRGVTQIWHTVEGQPTNDRLAEFGAFEFDPGYKRYEKTELAYQQNRIVDEPLRWGYLRDTIYGRLSHELIPRYEPDFAAVYFRGVDFVQHFFWQYTDRAEFPGVTDEEERAYGEVIANYYRYQDGLLGRLLDDLGDETNILLVSDHGFTARIHLDPNMPELTGMHDRRGVMIAAGPSFQRAGYVEGQTILDIAPTCLALMGLPVSGSMDGRVLTALMTPEHLEQHPPGVVDGYASMPQRTEKTETGSSMDESIKEQLRSLGYIQ